MIGIKYYEEFCERMQRSEVKEIEEKVSSDYPLYLTYVLVDNQVVRSKMRNYSWVKK